MTGGTDRADAVRQSVEFFERQYGLNPLAASRIYRQKNEYADFELRMRRELSQMEFDPKLAPCAHHLEEAHLAAVSFSDAFMDIAKRVSEEFTGAFKSLDGELRVYMPREMNVFLWQFGEKFASSDGANKKHRAYRDALQNFYEGARERIVALCPVDLQPTMRTRMDIASNEDRVINFLDYRRGKFKGALDALVLISLENTPPEDGGEDYYKKITGSEDALRDDVQKTYLVRFIAKNLVSDEQSFRQKVGEFCSQGKRRECEQKFLQYVAEKHADFVKRYLTT